MSVFVMTLTFGIQHIVSKKFNRSDSNESLFKARTGSLRDKLISSVGEIYSFVRLEFEILFNEKRCRTISNGSLSVDMQL